ncbi:MAG: hypothetical protein J6X08_06055, partial [Lachnospiraceae bacterium]|nr:hypothetical protein [Lachnospiraceae bacterium]
ENSGVLFLPWIPLSTEVSLKQVEDRSVKKVPRTFFLTLAQFSNLYKTLKAGSFEPASLMHINLNYMDV